MTKRSVSVLFALLAFIAGSFVVAVPASAANAPVVTKVIGTGTPESCTAAKLHAAVRTGGKISFNCGPEPITITLEQSLRVCNTHNCKHVWQGGKALTELTVDGGNKVTLDAQGDFGIFYANSCEESFGWLSDRCDLEKTLHIWFKNITLKNGNATKGVPGKDSVGGGGGGGAIAMRGNQLTVTGVKFLNNTCMTGHSDAGGGAIRVVGMTAKVRIHGSHFTGNKCANGGAVSSLHAAMYITKSVFTSNQATGKFSNGTGGNGGAIYYDGAGAKNVTIDGVTIANNKCTGGGSSVFYVSNDKKGSLTVQNYSITGNTGATFSTKPYSTIFFKGKKLTVIKSTA